MCVAMLAIRTVQIKLSHYGLNTAHNVTQTIASAINKNTGSCQGLGLGCIRNPEVVDGLEVWLAQLAIEGTNHLLDPHYASASAEAERDLIVTQVGIELAIWTNQFFRKYHLSSILGDLQRCSLPRDVRLAH